MLCTLTRIGKYAAQNGNERARKHFSTSFPSLSESIVRNFKRMYCNKLLEESRKHDPDVITSLPVHTRGRPPYMLKLDDKLIRFLKAIRSKGGVFNIHVVRCSCNY